VSSQIESRRWARDATSLASGLIFGFGLSLSGMLDPARVRGFLDVAGNFDPTLLFVLTGAVAVSAAGFLASRRMPRPLLDRAFHVPERRNVDRPLIVGSAIFGVGWGIGGFCPGPGIAALALGLIPPLVFTASMAGVLIFGHRAALAAWLLALRSRADKMRRLDRNRCR
jgi:uncharacterized membrane protein YedE/YeeE